MRRLCVSICCSAVLLGLVGSAAGKGFSDEAIDKAIKRGAEFLLTLQKDDGSFPGQGSYPIGPGALMTYALLESGVNPQEASMARALKWLAKSKTDKTYSLGLRCQVWLSANRTTKGKYLKLLEKDVEKLVKSTANGSYGYVSKGLGRSSGDNSNSQYGLLGVWAGALANLEGIPLSYWKKVLEHWRRTQCADGGWAYGGAAPTGKHTMVAAGIASYFVCLDNAYFASFRDCGGKGLPKDLRKGLKWFEKNFASGPMGDGYYLYGVERVGLASGLKYFGKADWYKLGATKLLAMQQADGSIPTGRGKGVGTSFAMLFLIRGRHPVLFNKLQRPGDWRNRPRELAALTRWLTVDSERTVNWQIINLKVPVDEWHDAPILYISGSKAPIFTDPELEKLRTFVWQGGTIFSVAECGGAGFKQGIREVYAKLFPKYELQKLDWRHKLYSVHYPLKSKPRFHMVSNSIRPLAIHCDEDLAKEWQLNRWATRAWAFRAADNVFNYVTDKGKLRARGVKHWPDKPKAMPPVTVTVARVKHAGQWNPEPLAFERLTRMMAKETGVGVGVLDGVAIDQLASSGADLAVLIGTTKIKLSGEQKRQLKAFVEGGGTLLFEAGGGSKAFGRSARAVIDNMFGFDALTPVLPFHPIYNIKDYPITKVTYRPKAMVRLDKSKQPNLWGVSVDGRLAAIYSREDITTGLVAVNPFGCDGYDPRSAFKIMRNILLYVADQKAARAGKAANPKAAGNVKVAAAPAKPATAGAKAKPVESAKSATDKPVAPKGGDGVRIPERP